MCHTPVLVSDDGESAVAGAAPGDLKCQAKRVEWLRSELCLSGSRALDIAAFSASRIRNDCPEYQIGQSRATTADSREQSLDVHHRTCTLFRPSLDFSFLPFFLLTLGRMQNGSDWPNLGAGSSSAPTRSSAHTAPVAATRTGSPPMLPPLTALEFGQSKFSLDTAVSTFRFHSGVNLDTTCELRSAGRAPGLGSE
jgi:hypothetical protein